MLITVFIIFFLPFVLRIVIVATYPMPGVQAKSKGAIKKTYGSRYQRLFKESIRKKPKSGLRILKIKVRELFTHREGISTPHVCHTISLWFSVFLLSLSLCSRGFSVSLKDFSLCLCLLSLSFSLSLSW